MPTRKASAVWEGNLKSGKGKMKLGSGAFEGAYSFATRFGEEPGTNPEELVGAAHAGCFSMALSHMLDGAGFKPNKIATAAEVKLEQVEDGFKITQITLNTKASIEGIDRKQFMEYAAKAKENCPVSQALKGVDIKLLAQLE